MPALDGHRTAELRSLLYHRRVASKIVAEPRHVQTALAKVDAVLQRESVDSGAAQYARAWRELLTSPVDELIAFMTSDTDRARDLRQSSPFAGALSPRERWDIWRATRGTGEP